MVLIRQTGRERDNLLFAFSEKLVTWEEGSENNSLRELQIPEPVLPENLTKGQIEVIQKETKNITWIELSKNGQYIAVTTENKQLVVLDKSFKTVKNVLLSRMANKISFTPTNDILVADLVADRTGDVYLYKMEDEQNQPVLLLGHFSVILDMVVTDCGKYIITCDRDEKIRVSNFPNAYNIVTYCLGHTEFVMTLKVLKNKNVLLSASGDGTIRIWDYLKGKQINKIDTKELAEDEILKQFASQMDTEKVDVTTLPITDMQIYEDNENVIIVTTLYKDNNISSRNQYGFRPGRDTEDGLHKLTAEITANLDSGNKCAAIFIDLAKVFDTVSPEKLDVLWHYGVRVTLRKLLDY